MKSMKKDEKNMKMQLRNYLRINGNIIYDISN